MADGIDVTIKAGIDGEGQLSGSGTLSIEGDASEFSCEIGYESADKLELKLSGKYKMSLLGRDAEVAGEISHNIFNGETIIEGDAKITIWKNISASVTPTFSSKDGLSAKAGIAITF